MDDLVKQATEHVFGEPEELDGERVTGFEFDEEFDFSQFMDAFKTTGMQATHLGKAVDLFRKIQEEREENGLKLFLGYTSNMVSSGNRELIRYLVEHNLVDVLVTTGGGVEEDLIKTRHDFVLGDFDADGETLRKNSTNRIGNIYASNKGYMWLEEFIQPILAELHEQQKTDRYVSTPSDIIKTLGERVDAEDSMYYWAAENNIPVYCPTFTDGAIGANIMLYTHEHEDFAVDLAKDIERLTMEALDAEDTAMIILGAGPAKHHVCQANILRGGCKYAIYINLDTWNTGSDGGADPDEAVSWGKIHVEGESVKVFCDATIAFPLIVAGGLFKPDMTYYPTTFPSASRKRMLST